MRVARMAALCAVTVLAATGAARAATPIPGFAEQTVAAGFSQAVGIDWTPDGRMVVVEKPGIVKVVNRDGSVVSVLDISKHVNSNTDRGLTGVAVDPQYASNNYVYLLYTFDATGKDDTSPETTRLVRITLSTANKVASANTVPETTILGSLPALRSCPAGNAYDCIPADGMSHVGGTVRAAPDGTLYVGTGDAMYAATDAPDPLRPLDETSLAGKVLHVDRTGKGLPGHAFCPTDSTLTDNCTKVFSQGFRNPFRFSLANRGGLWAGDVGESLWEEFDHLDAGGSYGWPCWEANIHNQALASDSRCQATYAAGHQTFPIWAYPHGNAGAAIIGGPEIRSSRFPADWQGDVFAGDIVTGRLSRLEIDNLGNLVGVQPFATGWNGADLRLGPDGYLYSASFYKILRYVPASGNRPPEAHASVAPVAGLAPFDAHFDGTASSDPDGDALSYLWDFGDGMGSTEAAPTHTYLANGRYTAKLTVTDPSGASASTTVPVTVGTTPPQIAFTQPAADFRYQDGVPVDVAVSATDAEDGTLPASAISWQILLQHNQHQHFIGTYTGTTAQFTPLTSHDSDSYYLVQVTATDSDGVSTTKTLRLDPQTVDLQLDVDPPAAASIFYNGAPQPVPFDHQAVVGFQTTIVAPDTVTDAGGQTLYFAGWSDGGAATHDIVIPAAGERLVATYRPDTTPPDTTITGTPGDYTTKHQPTFSFSSTEPGRFECQLDAGPWVKCSSPWQTWALNNGKHVFDVRAYDLAGNVDPTPAEDTFTIVPGENVVPK